MQSMKTGFGIIGALVPVAYCGGLLFYFLKLGGSAEGVVGIGLGPTVIGLGGVGLLLCIPLLLRVMRAVGDSSSAKSARRRGADGEAGADAAAAEDGDFDAAAALARYMAKKASGLIDVPPDEPSVRPSFGRKGL
jgi:hypothetical protein